MFFEQVLANAHEQLQQVASLFSVDEGLRQSYFSQVLDGDSVPNVEPLYAIPREARAEGVAGVVASQDDFEDRRSRVLDYLLGLYGESFSQKSLRHFSYATDEKAVAEELIHNKLRFLKSIVTLSGRRAGAFNYLEGTDDGVNCATLVSKLGVLLGMRDPCGGAPTEALSGKCQELVARPPQAAADTAAGEATGRSLRPVQPGTSGEIDEARLHAEVDFLKAGQLDIATLRSGVNIDNYRVCSGDAEGACQVLLKAVEGEGWYPIASSPSRDEADQLAHALRDFLAALNEQCERMLLVEHTLLRPRGEKPFGTPVDAGFFSFRISLVLPAWTVRCADAKFRHLAEESVALNCPAHIYPEILWLDYGAMIEFESLHKAWLEAMRQPEVDPNAIDAASEALIVFLQGHSGKAG